LAARPQNNHNALDFGDVVRQMSRAKPQNAVFVEEQIPSSNDAVAQIDGTGLQIRQHAPKTSAREIKATEGDDKHTDRT